MNTASSGQRDLVLRPARCPLLSRKAVFEIGAVVGARVNRTTVGSAIRWCYAAQGVEQHVGDSGDGPRGTRKKSSGNRRIIILRFSDVRKRGGPRRCLEKREFAGVVAHMVYAACGRRYPRALDSFASQGGTAVAERNCSAGITAGLKFGGRGHFVNEALSARTRCLRPAIERFHSSRGRRAE